jgi:hypothetical protein
VTALITIRWSWLRVRTPIHRTVAAELDLASLEHAEIVASNAGKPAFGSPESVRGRAEKLGAYARELLGSIGEEPA